MSLNSWTLSSYFYFFKANVIQTGVTNAFAFFGELFSDYTFCNQMSVNSKQDVVREIDVKNDKETAVPHSRVLSGKQLQFMAQRNKTY